MGLAAGTRLGPYEIVALLGAGGVENLVSKKLLLLLIVLLSGLLLSGFWRPQAALAQSAIAESNQARPTQQLAPNSADAQQSPIVEAFRRSTRETADRLQLVVEAMPADRFAYRATPQQQTFGEIVRSLAGRTVHLCNRITEAKPPAARDDAASAAKEPLVAALRDAFAFCDAALATFDDRRLADSTRVHMRDELLGWASVTRAYALVLATAHWADAYARLSDYLRLNGRVPPERCLGENSVSVNLNPPGCDSGAFLCVNSRPGRVGGSFTLADAAGYTVTSDGGGPYENGKASAVVVTATPVGLLLKLFGSSDHTTSRSIRVDLTRPVPGDIGVPLGVVSESQATELVAQWYTDSSNVSHSVLDIPVGTTVQAAQLDFMLHIDGKPHTMQLGPQPVGHCYSDPPAIYGTGTTQATIRREVENRWIVDLPPGSIGRLFDISLGEANAVNRGLYYVSLHFVVEQ